MPSAVSIILPYYNRKAMLELTLDSYENFYGSREDVEIVIVDDTSDESERVECLIEQYDSLNIVVTRLENKTGINPCYPYNVGVRESTGDAVVLSSPETFHTKCMFDITNNFDAMNDSMYFQMSVFCCTSESFKLAMLDRSTDFSDKLPIALDDSLRFYDGLGLNGYPFHNIYGSWYTHSKIRPSCLNFFSAMTRNTYNELCGFDERFRFGTGHDDEEFKLRMLDSGRIVEWFDDAIAIHIDHEIVNNMMPTTNDDVFAKTRTDVYTRNNDWGTI